LPCFKKCASKFDKPSRKMQIKIKPTLCLVLAIVSVTHAANRFSKSISDRKRSIGNKLSRTKKSVGNSLYKAKNSTRNGFNKRIHGLRGNEPSLGTMEDKQNAANSQAYCIDGSNCKSSWNLGKFTAMNWMLALNDNRMASEVTIPGTHDTFALQSNDDSFNGKWGWVPGMAKFKDDQGLARGDKLKQGKQGMDLVVTQVLSFTKQLELGLRAFDFRMIADPESSASEQKIRFTHNHVYQDSFFSDALRDALEFMKRNPGQFLIIKYKLEKGVKKGVKLEKSWFINRVRELCPDETKCVIETGAGSGEWASDTVGKLRNKIIFFSKR